IFFFFFIFYFLFLFILFFLFFFFFFFNDTATTEIYTLSLHDALPIYPKDCNTFWAQGGIIYEGENDSPAKLIEDVLTAGAGISNEEAVRFLAIEGPHVVKKLLLDEIHVPFSTTDEGELDLTQEGAHSMPRIIHAGDATGRAIEVSLLNRVRNEPNVTLATELTAIDLLTTQHHPTDVQVRYRLTNECAGAYLLDNKSTDVYTIFADFT